MLVTQLKLKNWRNFRDLKIDLGNRAFVIGPNASGKSNLLDALRFLKELAEDGGGLQKAISERGGLTKIRCLAARRDPVVHLEVHLAEDEGSEAVWIYQIGIRQQVRGKQVRGNRVAELAYEKVFHNNSVVIDRPNAEDENDPLRLTQTHLEQINANKGFRDVQKFLSSIKYLHIVPQLVRFSSSFAGPGVAGDPFGLHFLDNLALTPEKTRTSRLRKIQKALKAAVPQLEELSFVPDALGQNHLEAKYKHWRPEGGKQREDQFSDGTIRLIGLLWAMLEGSSLLLLEEPELSLHPAVIKRLAKLMFEVAGKRRQIIVTTHSLDLLSDQGIGGAETIVLTPSTEGTKAEVSSDNPNWQNLLDAGFSVGEAVLPSTAPTGIDQLQLEL